MRSGHCRRKGTGQVTDISFLVAERWARVWSFEYLLGMATQGRRVCVALCRINAYIGPVQCRYPKYNEKKTITQHNLDAHSRYPCYVGPSIKSYSLIVVKQVAGKPRFWLNHPDARPTKPSTRAL